MSDNNSISGMCCIRVTVPLFQQNLLIQMKENLSPYLPQEF